MPSRGPEVPGPGRTAWERLVERVAVTLRAAREGESYRARVRLHPPQLGSLELEAEWSGSLKVSLQAHTLQAFQALREGLENLRQLLLAQGFPLEDLQLSLKAGDGKGEGRWDGEIPRTPTAGPEGEAAPGARVARWRLGTLDLLV